MRTEQRRRQSVVQLYESRVVFNEGHSSAQTMPLDAGADPEMAGRRGSVGIVTALKVALAMKAQAQKVQRASQRRTSHMLNEKMLMQQATLAGRATFHGDFGGTAQSPEHRENKTFHV